MNIQDIFTTLRKANKLSMAKVARQSGLSPQMYRRFERGLQDPNIKQVVSILSVYNWELAGVKPKEI